MKLEIAIDPRVQNFVQTLSKDDQGRIERYTDLFNRYGFSLPSKYLKKLDRNLWELRPGNLRLLLGWTNDKKLVVISHCFKKKTQKTPIKELTLATNRLNTYS